MSVSCSLFKNSSFTQCSEADSTPANGKTRFDGRTIRTECSRELPGLFTQNPVQAFSKCYISPTPKPHVIRKYRNCKECSTHFRFWNYKILYTVSEKDFTFFFFLGAQCVESGLSCTDCY